MPRHIHQFDAEVRSARGLEGQTGTQYAAHPVMPTSLCGLANGARVSAAAGVVGALAGDGDAVGVALTHCGRRDTDESGALAQVSQGAGAGVAHSGAQATDELMDDGV